MFGVGGDGDGGLVDGVVGVSGDEVPVPECFGLLPTGGASEVDLGATGGETGDVVGGLNGDGDRLGTGRGVDRARRERQRSELRRRGVTGAGLGEGGGVAGGGEGGGL